MTSRATRTKRLPSDSASPRADRNHNSSRLARSSACCSRISWMVPCGSGRRIMLSHLSTERLAALADEQPTVDERHHLAGCALCARELESHRLVLAMAGSERDAMQLPLTRWESLSDRLRSEGLIAGAGQQRRGLARLVAGGARVPLQIAAALVLIATGVVMGRASTGEAILPGGLSGQEPASAPRTASTARASYDSLPTSFASLEDATRWRNAYADAYQRTVSFLAANDSGARQVGTPAGIRTRLSALDRVSRIMREAVNDAPYDPVINDFYLNSFGQREATLRQLNTVLPQGVRLNSF